MNAAERPTVRLTPSECAAEVPPEWIPPLSERGIRLRYSDVAAMVALLEEIERW